MNGPEWSMSMRLALSLIVCAILAAAGIASAQEIRDGTPGVITKGSGDTSIGGMPAARKGDATDKGTTVEGGSTNVFINGKPAVTTGDKTNCGGVTIGGAPNVFVNGKPVALTPSLPAATPTWA
jgi:uncharacterized Zn-binding protein involved in type VI secretion